MPIHEKNIYFNRFLCFKKYENAYYKNLSLSICLETSLTLLILVTVK